MKKIILSLIVMSFPVMALESNLKQTQRLFDAIEDGKINKAVRAIENGADVNSVNVDGRAPMHTALTRAIRLDRTEIAKYLIDRGADVNLRAPVTQYTPLMVAAQRDNAEVAQGLLDRGADVNALTVPMMRAPLNIAALRNSKKVTPILLSSGEIDINTRESLCPLAVAARQGHAEIAKMIYDVRDEKKLSDECLRSAIHKATLNKQQKVLDIIHAGK